MTETTPANGPTTEVLFFDGFDDLDAVAPYEILAAAGFPVRAVSFSAPPGTVTSAHGLRVDVDGPLGETPQLLVIPGGGWLDGARGGVRAMAQGELPVHLVRLHGQGTVLASVCTGAMVLAAAGLLRGRAAITHHSAVDDLARAGAEVRRDARVVDGGDLVTCGGPTAGIDLSLHLVERFCGPAAAQAGAQRIEHERVGPIVMSAAVRAA
ncbi:MAG TPA: DJ-1/PfpI family protein [Solirubrobacteraceae bacterium]|jgi:transcriptional regulator GlxA family with amidase domain